MNARWLAQGRILQAWSLLLAALGLAALVLLPPPALGSRWAWAVLMLVPGLLAALSFVRIGLDAALFDDLAEGRLQSADLDAALASVRPDAPASRSMAARCRGAQAWWWRGVACVAAQAALLPVLLYLSSLGA